MPISTITTLTPSNADAAAIVASVTPSGAGALTLATTSFSMGRIVIVTDAGNNTGKSLTIVGTDPDGNTISETIAGTSSSVGVSTNYFKTITSVTASAAYSNAITVGTIGTTLSAASQTIPLDYLNRNASTLSVVVTGTINFSVQESFTDILKDGTANTVWGTPSAFSAKTASTTGVLDKGATGIRLIVNSYSSGATIGCTVIPGCAE